MKRLLIAAFFSSLILIYLSVVAMGLYAIFIALGWVYCMSIFIAFVAIIVLLFDVELPKKERDETQVSGVFAHVKNEYPK